MREDGSDHAAEVQPHQGTGIPEPETCGFPQIPYKMATPLETVVMAATARTDCLSSVPWLPCQPSAPVT